MTAAGFPAAEDARYRPQLDGLRAFAVIAVLYSHYWGGEQSVAGSLGVRLFFVLSGYLITGMLLEARDRGTSPLRNFYARRALRLLPAFYALLGACLLVDTGGIRAVGPWHALYASNILFALQGDYVPWYTAAWWTLAVEEHFYLLWPLVIMTGPRRWLPWICLAALPLALGWRGAVEWMAEDYFPNLLLPASLDALAGGSLLALLARDGSRWLRWVGLAGCLSALGWAVLVALGQTWTWWAPVAQVPMFVAIVHYAGRGIGGWVGRILASPPALYGGRISYGIYLYHLPVWYGLTVLLGPDFIPSGWALFTVGTLVSVCVAALSWHLLEAPCNKLKHRFPFPSRVPASSTKPSTA
jgi:peptidoglycan/LPS O-acetylase OafA/YrhL